MPMPGTGNSDVKGHSGKQRRKNISPAVVDDDDEEGEDTGGSTASIIMVSRSSGSQQNAKGNRRGKGKARTKVIAEKRAEKEGMRYGFDENPLLKEVEKMGSDLKDENKKPKENAQEKDKKEKPMKTNEETTTKGPEAETHVSGSRETGSDAVQDTQNLKRRRTSSDGRY